MVVEDQFAPLLDEWNRLFPDRQVPPYKFRPDNSVEKRLVHPEQTVSHPSELLFRASQKRPDDNLNRKKREKRVWKIYNTFCDYLLFEMIRKRIETVGLSMDKLQESHIGKVSRVDLGIDLRTESVWWTHGGLNRSNLKFRDIIRLDYGLGSSCYVKLKSNFSPGSVQSNMVAPWNCFSLVTSNRTYDFYALSNGLSGASEDDDSLVPTTIAFSKDTSLLNSIDIENYLFAFSYVLRTELRNKYTIGGLFESKKHLALIRGKIKISYILRKPPVLPSVSESPPKSPINHVLVSPTRDGHDYEEEPSQEIAEEFEAYYSP